VKQLLSCCLKCFSSKDDPRAKQLSTGKKKFNIDPDKVGLFPLTVVAEQNKSGGGAENNI